MEITLTINAPELVQALNNLAEAVATADVASHVQPCPTVPEAVPAVEKSEEKAKQKKTPKTKADVKPKAAVPAEKAPAEDSKPEMNEAELREALKRDCMAAAKKDKAITAKVREALKKHGTDKLSGLKLDDLASFRREVLGE